MTHLVVISGTNRVESDFDSDCPTVDDVRGEYEDVINIPADAVPTVNGSRANGSTRLYAGDEVAFTKPTGSKG